MPTKAEDSAEVRSEVAKKLLEAIRTADELAQKAGEESRGKHGAPTRKDVDSSRDTVIQSKLNKSRTPESPVSLKRIHERTNRGLKHCLKQR